MQVRDERQAKACRSFYEERLLILQQ